MTGDGTGPRRETRGNAVTPAIGGADTETEPDSEASGDPVGATTAAGSAPRRLSVPRQRVARMLKRRPGQLAGAVLACLGLIAGITVGIAAATPDDLLAASASEPAVERYHRIAAGSVDGAGFRIGRRIAGAISQPNGAVACAPMEGCGVPGLIAVATTMTPEMVGAVSADRAPTSATVVPGGRTPSVEGLIMPFSAGPIPMGFQLVGVVRLQSGQIESEPFVWLVEDNTSAQTVLAMVASVWRLALRPDADLALAPSGGAGPLPALHKGAWTFYRTVGRTIEIDARRPRSHVSGVISHRARNNLKEH